MRVVLLSCLFLLAGPAFAEKPRSAEETILLLRQATTFERAQTILLGIRTEYPNAERDVLLKGEIAAISQLPIPAQQALILNSNVGFSEFQDTHWDRNQRQQTQWKDAFAKGTALRVIDRVVTMESVGFKSNYAGFGMHAAFTAMSIAMIPQEGGVLGVLGVPLFGTAAISYASNISRNLKARAELFKTLDDMRDNGFPIPEDVAKYAGYFEKEFGGHRLFPPKDRDLEIGNRLTLLSKQKQKESNPPTVVKTEPAFSSEISARLHELLKPQAGGGDWSARSFNRNQWTETGPEIIDLLREVKEENLVLDDRTKQTIRHALLSSRALRKIVGENDLIHGPEMDFVRSSYPDKTIVVEDVLSELKGLKNGEEARALVASYSWYFDQQHTHDLVFAFRKNGYLAYLPLPEAVLALEQLPADVREAFVTALDYSQSKVSRVPGANKALWRETFSHNRVRYLLGQLVKSTPEKTKQDRETNAGFRKGIQLSGMALIPVAPVMAGFVKGAGIALEAGVHVVKYLPTDKNLMLSEVRRLVGNDFASFPKDLQDGITTLYAVDPRVRHYLRNNANVAESCAVALGGVSGR